QVSAYPDNVGNLRKHPKRKMTASAMLMMLHKASEQTASMMMEERKLRKEARQDEQQDFEARQEQVWIQAQLDRVAMDQCACKAEMRAAQRDTDRKQEVAQQDANRKQERQEATALP
ncbi:hypothetical protein VP01_3919g3, partial [Puccinia sorghi]